jgi:hypothetical protein
MECADGTEGRGIESLRPRQIFVDYKNWSAKSPLCPCEFSNIVLPVRALPWAAEVTAASRLLEMPGVAGRLG